MDTRQGLDRRHERRAKSKRLYLVHAGSQISLGQHSATSGHSSSRRRYNIVSCGDCLTGTSAPASIDATTKSKTWLEGDVWRRSKLRAALLVDAGSLELDVCFRAPLFICFRSQLCGRVFIKPLFVKSLRVLDKVILSYSNLLR